MVNGLARCDISHLYLTGQLKLLAHCYWTGWPCIEYDALCRLTGRLCIVSIFDCLASLVLYSSAAGWPAMGCNPMLGLWTGQPCIEYESHCRLTGPSCIYTFFDC